MQRTRIRRRAFSTQQVLLFSGAMGSGAALVTSILTGVALGSTLTIFVAYASLISAFFWSRASFAERRLILGQVRVGIIAGIVGTTGYDLSRLALVKAAGIDYRPFETLVLFGRSIGGARLDRTHAYAVGALYHGLNGILFAIGYTFLLGNRKWFWGIFFALMLELAMLQLYPRWIDVQSVREEFAIVSLTGHVAYGAIIGLISSRMRHRGNNAAGQNTLCARSQVRSCL
jgi:hypothetical protein